MSNIIERQTLSSQVAERLRVDIITSEFPIGSRITVKNISERYNTSPLPVREAFNILAGEKLVILEPYKGARVCEVDKKFFVNIYSIMNALEMMAAESCIENWSSKLEYELRQINNKIAKLQSMDLINNNYQGLNKEFHTKIEQFFDNDQAIELIKQYRKVIDLVTKEKDSVLVSVDRLNESVKEHNFIIDSLSLNNYDGVMKAYRIHSINSRNAAINKIFANV